MRAQRIGWLDELDDLWVGWERWFIEIEEAHTNCSALNYFRSPHAELSWITSAGYVFDIDHDAEPSPTDPVAVTREEFDRARQRLVYAGLPVRADAEACWRTSRAGG